MVISKWCNLIVYNYVNNFINEIILRNFVDINIVLLMQIFKFANKLLNAISNRNLILLSEFNVNFQNVASMA